jgi:hypothetical protein
MHFLNTRSAGISVSAAAYCRQIDTIAAARSSAPLGPVCPWTAVPATTHINAATALANQAHFGTAECARARTSLCQWGAAVTRAAATCVPFATSDHNYTSNAFGARAVPLGSILSLTLPSTPAFFTVPGLPQGSGMCRIISSPWEPTVPSKAVNRA